MKLLIILLLLSVQFSYAESLTDMLKRHEGLKLTRYEYKGKFYIGYGHQLNNNVKIISKQQADKLLAADIEWVRGELLKRHSIVAGLSENRQNALVNMAFNMGVGALCKFSKMWDYIYVGQFDKAANEVLDSAYARSLPRRAEEISKLIKEG